MQPGNLLNNTTFHLRTVTESLSYKCELTDFDLLYVVLSCVIIITGIIGNTFVLYAFRPNKRSPRHNYEILIWYLSLFDLAACVILIVDMHQTIRCHSYWPFGLVACKVFYPCYNASFNISICILLIISFERFRSITLPFKKKLPANVIHASVFNSVVISFTLQWYQFYTIELINTDSNSPTCSQTKSIIYSVPRCITILFRDFMFVSTFGFSSYKISKSLVARQKRSLIKTNSQKSKKNNQKILTMLLMMGGTFIILVVPYDVFDSVLLVSRMLPKKFFFPIDKWLVYVDMSLAMLQMSSSVVNWFIYAKTHRRFKLTVRDMFKSKEQFTLIYNTNISKITIRKEKHPLESKMESVNDNSNEQINTGKRN